MKEGSLLAYFRRVTGGFPPSVLSDLKDKSETSVAMAAFGSALPFAASLLAYTGLL